MHYKIYNQALHVDTFYGTDDGMDPVRLPEEGSGSSREQFQVQEDRGHVTERRLVRGDTVGVRTGAEESELLTFRGHVMRLDRDHPYNRPHDHAAIRHDSSYLERAAVENTEFRIETARQQAAAEAFENRSARRSPDAQKSLRSNIVLGSSSSSQENSHSSSREKPILKTEKEELDPMLAPGGARTVPIKKRTREDRLREDA